MKTHKLIISNAFSDDILNGDKLFEIRENNEGYQKGDFIKFTPYNPATGLYDNNHPITQKEYQITYVLNGFGLKNGYVVLGFKEIKM